MVMIQVFPETLVGTADGSVMVPSMGIVDTPDEALAEYIIGMNHGAYYTPPPPEGDTRGAVKNATEKGKQQEGHIAEHRDRGSGR